VTPRALNRPHTLLADQSAERRTCSDWAAAPLPVETPQARADQAYGFRCFSLKR
jgi:hypothetical protein